MFIRNGEALGSVLHSAVPGASPPPVPAPAEEPEPQPEPRLVERPKDHDSKADWVDYAVACTAGTDHPLSVEDASESTKAELIELYGG